MQARLAIGFSDRPLFKEGFRPYGVTHSALIWRQGGGRENHTRSSICAAFVRAPSGTEGLAGRAGLLRGPIGPAEEKAGSRASACGFKKGTGWTIRRRARSS